MLALDEATRSANLRTVCTAEADDRRRCARSLSRQRGHLRPHPTWPRYPNAFVACLTISQRSGPTCTRRLGLVQVASTAIHAVSIDHCRRRDHCGRDPDGITLRVGAQPRKPRRDAATRQTGAWPGLKTTRRRASQAGRRRHRSHRPVHPDFRQARACKSIYFWRGLAWRPTGLQGLQTKPSLQTTPSGNPSSRSAVHCFAPPARRTAS